ncbi:peptidoglycan-binding protein [Streptomyces sp. WAC 06738]|uniref:efflux RND transporter periplasmic adaptor subunit n=1 Tax=Streptomyces sp. WAC 06738 TaxID=2203210 RepID=UPI000F6B7286|nr:peptidoglycan-binding protein [Streptomyces sp. WAC 06738]AZM49029.1 peptidoglycan-binding protein [Streptomyces sp. WAC 06738]
MTAQPAASRQEPGPGDPPAADRPAADPTAGGPGADPSPPRRGRHRRRRRRIAAGAVFLAATGGAAAAGLGLGGTGDPAGAADGDLPPATAEVTRGTLVDTRSADAELGHGPATGAAARTDGTLTELPRAGARVTRGEALYELDDEPVTLLYGDLPAYRALAPGAEGTDVAQLERNLSALGYTGFTVDDAYSGATAAAVRDWQADLGAGATGRVEPGQVVFAPGPVVVASVDAQRGDLVAPGADVLTYTGTDVAVTAELDVADRRLARRGAKAGVELPDGRTVRGTVAEVSVRTRPADGEQEARTVVEVVVRLEGAEARKAASAYDEAGVHVDFTAGRRENVLTVPVAALLALAEGGFGVEVVTDGTTRYVPVETGLFAGGRVEVSGEGLTAGTKVGMPR